METNITTTDWNNIWWVFLLTCSSPWRLRTPRLVPKKPLPLVNPSQLVLFLWISIDSKCNLHQFAGNWAKCGTDPASEWGHFWFMQQLQERLGLPTFLQQRWSWTGQGCSAPLEPAAKGPGGKTAAPRGKRTAGEAACGHSSLPSAGETQQHK